MKDSKETEHRISNLRGLLENIQNDEVEDTQEYVKEEENIEEDEELIEYLNDDVNNLEIDDEFIYHPGKDDNIYAINLEEDKIDEDFIIKTDFDEKEALKNEEDNQENVILDDFETELSENLDNILNATIREKPVLAIISLILGIIFIILSIIVFNSGSERIIDNVVSGENRYIMVILLIAGILFILYGVYKIFGIKSPFDNLASSIRDIETDKKEKEVLKKPQEEEKKILIPKSDIPLDREAYKIGEFDISEIRKTLQKPTSKKEEKLPPKDEEKPSQENELTTEEIEEIEYEKAHLENETIDEIFAGVEDIEDIPIISVDSKEDKEE